MYDNYLTVDYSLTMTLERDALAAIEAMKMKAAATINEGDTTRAEKTGITDPDMTTIAGSSSKAGVGKSAAPAVKKVVKGKKPQMTAKERKQRNVRPP